MPFSLLWVYIPAILLCISIQSVSGQTVEQGELQECEGSWFSSFTNLSNITEDGQPKVKIIFGYGVDGPDPRYDCFSLNGYATCINRKQYKKYGIPKSAEGACILTDDNIVKVVYVGFSANSRDILLFEKIIESGKKKQSFKKVRKCEDITEYN
jgi:hypothetical protein